MTPSGRREPDKSRKETEAPPRPGADEELATAQQAVRELIEAAPYGAHLYELRPDGRLVFVGANTAADRTLGLDHRPLVGQTVEEAFPSLVGTPLPDAYRRVAATGERYGTELVQYEDERISGAFEVSALRTGSGRMVALFRDITERKRAEAALRQSEARCWELSQELHALLDAIPDCVALLSPELRFVWANEGTASALSTKRSDLVGRTCYELWHARDGACEDCPGVQSLRSGESAAGHIVDRHGRVWEHRAVPVRDEGGAIIGVLQVSRDVTERRRGEEERDRLLAEVGSRAAELEATIASIPDGVIIYGPEGEIARMNAAAERMLGYSEEQRGLPIADRLALLRVETPDGRPLAPTEHPPSRALRGETLQGLVLVIHPPTGGTLWVSTGAAPIRSVHGDLLGAVFVMSDVTALHALEEQREDMIRAVSHDLRTPLVSVGGFAQLLARRLQEAGAETEANYADIIVAGTRRMQAMIAELVDAVRLESRQASVLKQPVGLGVLVPEVLTRLGGALETARVDLAIPLSLPPVLADPGGLERILQNLVSNALKYSPPEAPVTIVAEETEGGVRVSVIDRGLGISPADLPHVFERFFRVEGVRRTDGLGLGLYITRMLVEAQGGRIEVESEEGRGSTFIVTLPLA